ncbi:MAG: hypothetical protein H6Q89_3257, partial [Myxococcaceae bacterium]|nr:hypothetical protein [Myxococcaceae bacterium]
MAPPPSKRSPAVERGGKDAENDPERLQGTQAKIKVPSVARGSRAVDRAADEDPEVSKHTQAKVKIPRVAQEEDPEVSKHTQAKV